MRRTRNRWSVPVSLESPSLAIPSSSFRYKPLRLRDSMLTCSVFFRLRSENLRDILKVLAAIVSPFAFMGFVCAIVYLCGGSRNRVRASQRCSGRHA